LYIWFQRTSPYPSLVGFDAPEAVLVCTRRDRSDTPLQSLTLLNDSVYVECAQALGRKMMGATSKPAAETDHAADDQIRYAFENALSRDPLPVELAALHKLYREAQNLYRSEPEAAQRLTGGANADKPTADAAACVAVARAILNLDEFITRE
jgi:hypothetical protein